MVSPERAPDFHERRWLDDPTSRSLASIMAIAEKGYGILSLSDGHTSVTLDFFYSTPEERDRALRKAQAIQELVDEFCTRIRLLAPPDKVPEDSGVSLRITP